MFSSNLKLVVVGMFAVSTLIACGGGGSRGGAGQPNPPAAAPTVTIGGTVSGLATGASGLVLTNNGGDHLAINANGAFVFLAPVASGSTYDIRVLTQPYDPYQACHVQNGSGTVADAAINAPTIACTTLVPKFVTSLDSQGFSYSQYAIDVPTGQLRSRGYVLIRGEPVDVGAQTMGQVSFVLHRRGGLHAFARDADTGRLTEAPNSPQATGAITAPPSPSYGAASLTVHPRLNFVYVANGIGGATGDSIAAFAFDGATGALSPVPGSPFAAGSDPVKLAIDPSGRFAYALNRVSDDITTYSINQTTGALSPVGPVIAGGDGPSFPVIHPSGKFLYVSNLPYGESAMGTLSAFSIGPGGVLTRLPNSPFAVAPDLTARIVAHPSGRFLYVKTQPGFLIGYRVDETTGALAAIGAPMSLGALSQTIWMEQSGRYLFVANRGDRATGSVIVLRVNATTGELTRIPSPALDSVSPAPFAVSLDWSGKFLYVASADGHAHLAFTFDVATGAATPSDHVAARDAPVALIGVPASDAMPAAFSSKFAHVPSNTAITAYSISPSNGAFTRQGSAGDSASLTAPASGAVAHPSNRALLGLLNQPTNFLLSHPMNATTGALASATAAQGIAALPGSLVLDTSGRFAFVAEVSPGAGPIRQYSWDAMAGSIAAHSYTTPVSSQLKALTMHPTGRHVYFVTHDRLGKATIDPFNGQMGGAAEYPASTGGHSALAIHPSGRFAYVARRGTPGAIDVYPISLRDIAPVVFPSSFISVGNEPRSMSIDPTGRFLYIADGAGQYELRAYRIEKANGSLSPVETPALTFNSPVIVRTDYSGRFVHIVETVAALLRSYQINATTGVLTQTSAPPIATGSGPSALALTEDIE